MVSKYFLNCALVVAACLLLGVGANPAAAGHGGGGGGGGGHGGGGGGHGGYGGGGYGHGGYGGGYGYGGRGYGYGGGFYGGGFYGGGLFYGDYMLGGGYPGYFAPYAYPYAAPSYYPAPLSYGDPYSARISSYPPIASNSAYYPPIAASNATIRVVLPDPQATVLFDGRKTTSTGAERYYDTPALTPGGSYEYQVQVSWMQDGKLVSDQRSVAVTPGKTTDVVFSRTGAQPARVISSVK